MKRFRENYPILFSVFAIAIFLIFMFSGSFLSLTFMKSWDPYFANMVFEILEVLLVAGIIVASGLGRIFTRRGNGFKAGLISGGYFIAVSGLALVSGGITVRYQDLLLGMEEASELMLEKKYLLPPGHILTFVILMATVGMAEEFLYRGILAECMIRRFGCDRKGIMLAGFFTGFLFGLTHMVNARSTGPLSAFVQAVAAGIMGIALTLIYYISGNLWSVVFLHGLVDFSGLAFNGGIYGTGSYSDLIDSMKYGLVNLVAVVPYLILILFLIRKKNIIKIQSVFGESELEL